MNAAATNTPIVFYVLSLQEQGMTPLQTSLGFIPCNIAIIIASVLVPRLAARRGVTGAMAWGMSIVLAGLLVLSTLPLGGTYLRTFLPGLLLVGFGLGWAQVGIVGTAAESVSATEQGIAAGLVNTGAQAPRSAPPLAWPCSSRSPPRSALAAERPLATARRSSGPPASR